MQTFRKKKRKKSVILPLLEKTPKNRIWIFTFPL